MRKYRQLTEEDRLEIYAMKQAGKELSEIELPVSLGFWKLEITRIITYTEDSIIQIERSN